MTTIRQAFFGDDRPVSTGDEVSHDDVVGIQRVGIEIELENVTRLRNDSEFRRHWSVIEDHSLRSTNGSSQEWIIRGTTSGVGIVDALSSAYESIEQNNISPRTALHVHVDMRDLSYTQVQDILVLYVALEGVFDAVGGGVRGYNNFSLDMKRAQRLTRLIGELVCSQSAVEFRQNLNDADAAQNFRYAGLNVASLESLGSLEFRNRCTPATYDEALQWVNLVLSVVEYVIQYNGERLPFMELFQMMSGDAIGSIIKEVFTHHTVAPLVQEASKDINFYEYMRRAQAVINHSNRNDIHNRILRSVV